MNSAAMKYFAAIVRKLLPDGQLRGHHWIGKNANQRDQRPGSFKIDLRAKQWSDSRSSEWGRDVIGLAAFLKRLKRPKAVHEVSKMLSGEPGLFDALTPEDIAGAPVVPPEELLIPVVPVPDDAPAMTFRHPTYGEPSAAWPYRDCRRRLVGHMLRFDYPAEDGESGKEYLPVTYCRTAEGFRWRSKGFPSPRPLYRLPEVLDRASATVIVCEGEKAADASAKLFPGMVATTCAFGPQGVAEADWSVLAGRRVVVAPDNDDGGRRFCERVCELAYREGATEVFVLVPEKIGGWVWRDGVRVERELVPAKWDLADAEREGWTAASLSAVSDQPDFLRMASKPLVYDERGCTFRMGPAGVEAKPQDDWISICGPLSLIAQTRDSHGENWGKLFEVTNPDGERSEWVMPMEHLAAEGVEYRKELLSRGLRLAPGEAEREELQRYLSLVTTEKRARTVSRLGWHDSVYVTNAGVIGQPAGAERVLIGIKSRSRVGLTSGNLADWQKEIALPASGNSRLAFALSAAFAAPLLLLAKAESGGFHFVGKSSVGKTTALVIAGSVWGGGGPSGYINSWRTTDNGLEGIAGDHCDALLCLDEMGQVSSRTAGACAYMLANGVGKVRATKTGAARSPAEWRTLFLSTGEIGLADKVGEDTRNAPVAAGQQIRIIDLEADAGRGLGLFDHIHDHDGAPDFARQLKASADAHYGHAGPAFVAKILQDKDGAVTAVAKLIEEFIDRHLPSGADGQVERVARKFGLIAAAGELATKFGVLPGYSGEATKGVASCFKSWLESRGTLGSLEDEEAVAVVRAFIEEHGSSRFINADFEEDSDVMKWKVHGRVGFFKVNSDAKRHYCFFSEMWKREVCKGRDHRAVARALKARGFLITENETRLNKPLNVRGKNVRVFIVKEEIMLEPPLAPELPQISKFFTQ